MKKTANPSPRRDTARRRTDKSLHIFRPDIADLPAKDVQKLVQDLQTHQIELEMQNEELRNIQQELQEARDKYCDLYDFAPVGYLTVDHKSMIREINLAGADLLGVEKHYVIGKPLVRYVISDDQNQFHLHLRAAFERKTRQACELQLTRSDDTTFYARLESIAIQDMNGNVTQCRTAISSITKRKQMEEALRKQTHVLGRWIKELNCLYAMLNLTDQEDASLDQIVQGAVDLIPTAWQHPEIICARVILRQQEFRTDNFSETDWKQISGIVVHGQWIGSLEVCCSKNKLENGENPFSKGDKSLINAVAGRLAMAVERKEGEDKKNMLENQLLKSHKIEAVGQLAGGIAHNFNNLLTVITGNVELLLEQLKNERPNSDPLIKALEHIDQAGQRGAALTRQLLTFGRGHVLKLEAVNLNQTIGDIENMLRKVISEQITFKIIRDPNVEYIHADPGQIQQLVMNLVLNARDAMPQGGELTIETDTVFLDQSYLEAHHDAHPGLHALLRIKDTGIGMSRETLDRLFEPFFTTKPVGKGTGLGLATVHGIVSQMGGHITVDSTPDQGSCFSIYFPVSKEWPDKPITQPPDKPRRGRKTILVCEDEEEVRKLVCRILESSGYTVLSAENGQQGLAVATGHHEPIHLLITDVIMPSMNGKDLAKALRSIHPDMPVLFISGYLSDELNFTKALDEGMDLLEKPFSSNGLLERVGKILDTVQSSKS